MNRYIVYVKKSELVRVEVEAETDEAALDEAKQRARYYQPVVSYSEQVESAEIKQKGPAGEPLVKCPTEWEIYSSMPGSKAANKAITSAAQKVTQAMLKASKSRKDIGHHLVMGLIEKHVKPVFAKYREFGTGDTEPRANMANYVSKYAKGLGADDPDRIYEEVRWNL